MGAHVGDFDTEVAATFVDIELTHLEDTAGAVCTPVEVGEYHVVAEQLGKVAIAEHQLLDIIDRSGFLLEGLVGVDQGEQLGLAVGLEQRLDLVQAEGLDGLALLRTLPGSVGTELGENIRPLLLGEGLRGGIVHVEHEGLQVGESRLPGGVDGIQRQEGVFVRAGQRIGGDLLALRGEVLLADGADLVGRHVHGRCDGGIEADQLAAHEEVGHLVLHRLAGGEGGGGIVPVGQDRGRVGRSGILPGGIVGEGRVEGLDLLRRDARLPATVGGRTDLLGNRRDERLQGLVFGGSLGDDAVAVEAGLREDGHAVGGFVHRDLVLFEAEVREDLFRGIIEFLSGFAIRIDAVEFQHALPFEDGVLVLDHGGQPLRRRHDLGHADAAVAVGVDEVQGPLVDGEVLGRTAEDRPKFLVKFSEVGDILARGDADPGHSAEGAILPGIAGVLFLCHN